MTASTDTSEHARGRDAAIDALSIFAVALWLGGLVVLGAIVAPTVFRNVPAPSSADAMTLVFRRFDRIALTCAAVAAVAEAARLALGTAGGRLAWVRALLLAAAASLAIAEGTVLSPEIEALHRGGAIRGLDADGQRLEEFHRWAERAGKGQVALLALYVGALAWGRANRARCLSTEGDAG